MRSVCDRANPASAQHQIIARMKAVLDLRRQQAAAFQNQSGGQAAGRIRRQQGAVREIRRTRVSQIKRESRHLRLIRVADEKSGGTHQHRHRQQYRVAPPPPAWSPRYPLNPRIPGGRVAPARSATVGRLDQPNEQRSINERIDENAVDRAEHQQQNARRPPGPPENAR